MISFSRADARRFRSLLRRSILTGTARGRCPPITATTGPDGTTLQASSLDVGLVLRIKDEPGPVEKINFPGEMLSDVEGTGDAAVALEALSAKSVRMSWQEGPIPRSVEFPPLDASDPIAACGADLASMPDDFIRALDDACRTAARESAPRYALSRVQLRGKAGEIVATDGKQLLLQGGFTFPFSEEILIPALPVFNAKDLTTATPVSLGRLKNRVAVQAGPWQIHIAIDGEGRFPDFRQVIPRGQPATQLILDDADAEYLVDVLPGLPGDHEPSPLTLDLNGLAIARATADGKHIELELCGTRVTGKPMCLCVDRRLFFRALRLGFRAFDVFSPSKPIVSQDSKRLLVLMIIEPNSILSASPDAVRLTTTGRDPTPSNPTAERKALVATPTSNGHTAEQPETFDPLTEAEGIKAVAQELLTRATRLVAYLKQFRRQRQTIQSALQSLSSLKLGA